jgi:hypothetical protein
MKGYEDGPASICLFVRPVLIYGTGIEAAK